MLYMVITALGAAGTMMIGRPGRLLEARAPLALGLDVDEDEDGRALEADVRGDRLADAAAPEAPAPPAAASLRSASSTSGRFCRSSRVRNRNEKSCKGGQRPHSGTFGSGTFGSGTFGGGKGQG